MSQKARSVYHLCWTITKVEMAWVSTLVSYLWSHPSQILSSQLEKVNIHFITLTPDNFHTAAPLLSQPYSHDLLTTWRLETECCYVLELRENCLKQVIDIEVNMGIDKRWDPSSPEYLETLGYLSTRTYQHVLEELWRLVIQHLFKLHKMNISATGECSLHSDFW